MENLNYAADRLRSRAAARHTSQQDAAVYLEVAGLLEEVLNQVEQRRFETEGQPEYEAWESMWRLVRYGEW